MRCFLLMAWMGLLLGCAKQFEIKVQDVPPTAYLKPYETVFDNVVRAAQDLSWEVTDSNKKEGTVVVNAPSRKKKGQEYELMITIKRRSDGLIAYQIADGSTGESKELREFKESFAFKLREFIGQKK